LDNYKFVRVKGSPVSDRELIDDLKTVANLTNKKTVTQNDYKTWGKFDCSTQSRRFGTWNDALKKAGLFVSNEPNLSDERLYENILTLWQYLGRQPRRRELSLEISKISQSPYNRRFGSWTAALETFVKYMNENDQESGNVEYTKERRISRITGRDPSLRLRFKVLKRDNFRCVSCGASPALTPGIELHVDHIIAWSNGGETVPENLQTLCSNCNLGKSNVE